MIDKYHPVAVIVPAFNEYRGICRVLSVISQTEWLEELVVVDDGSKDQTVEVTKKYAEKDKRLRVISHPKNYGKGQAVLTGLEATTAKIIITIDADLFGLNSQHLLDLARPVFMDKVDMTIAVFRKGRWYTDMSHMITPWLTGQRCLLREKLMSISWEAATGYGLETAIAIAARNNRWRNETVYWMGVSHPPSEGHRGIVKGIANRGKMYAHIMRALLISNRAEINSDIYTSKSE